jgi:hypothetical protein
MMISGSSPARSISTRFLKPSRPGAVVNVICGDDFIRDRRISLVKGLVKQAIRERLALVG